LDPRIRAPRDWKRQSSAIPSPPDIARGSYRRRHDSAALRPGELTEPFFWLPFALTFDVIWRPCYSALARRVSCGVGQDTAELLKSVRCRANSRDSLTVTKFAILTTQRSGATFFRTCLESHPEISCPGTLYSSHHQVQILQRRSPRLCISQISDGIPHIDVTALDPAGETDTSLPRLGVRQAGVTSRARVQI
jgi:hypothetical protein